MAEPASIARFAPSPNHDEREGVAAPDILLLHYTGMPTAEAALARLTDPDAKVSSHYLVQEDGSVLQLVTEDRRAWHAGAGSWEGRDDVNSRSIGIEIVNPGHDGGLPAYPDAQIAAVIGLARAVVGHWTIRPDRVLAHSDVAPGRKHDPGERFPWDRLAGAGIGHWVAPEPPGGGVLLGLGHRGEAVEAVQEALALYGYGIARTGEYDAATVTVVEAFQRHFRPALVDGRLDGSTLSSLRQLIETRPD